MGQGVRRTPRLAALTLAALAVAMPAAAASPACDALNATPNRTFGDSQISGLLGEFAPGETVFLSFISVGDNAFPHVAAHTPERYNRLTRNTGPNDSVQFTYTTPGGMLEFGNTGSDTVRFVVSCEAPMPVPTLSALSPVSGPLTGGTSVTATGTGFVVGATTVQVGDTTITAANVTVNSATSLTFATPAHALGNVSVVVATSGGTSAAIPGGFTYVSPPPIANPVSATVAYGSTNNPIALDLTGPTAQSVEIGTQATHGTAVADGTVITYTPTAGYGGPDSFTYVGTGAGGSSTPATVTITVTAPTLTFDTTALPGGRTGFAYDQTVTASGGSGPYAYSISAGALPAGLTLNLATGQIAGTPTGTGTSSFTIRAEDSSTGTGPYVALLPISITIVAPNPPVAGPTDITVAYGSSNNAVVLNLTGGAPTGVAIASQPGNGVAVATDAAITYTPNAGYWGTDSFTYTATNADGTSAPANVAVTIALPQITVAPTSLPAPQVGVDYRQTLTASGGTGTSYVFSHTGTLPSGLTLSTDGVLSGTPTAGGTTNFIVTAADALEPDLVHSRSYSLTTEAPTLLLTPAADLSSITTLPSATGDVAYSQTITTAGGTAPYSYTIDSGELPPGLTLSAAGEISGTPTQAGPFAFVVRSTDSSIGTRYRVDGRYSILVAAPNISISPTSLANGTVGQGYSQPLIATGGSGFSFGIVSGSLPAGMTLRSAGVLSGRPTASGTFDFTVQATASSGFSGEQALSLVIAAPTVTLSSAPLPNATTRIAYSQPLTAAGGTAPYSFEQMAGALPPGMTLSTAGVLSGAPTAAGTFTFTVKTTDSTTGDGPYNASLTFTLEVESPTIELAPEALPSATTRVAYSRTLTASGGVGPYGFEVTAGALPAGVTLSQAGVLSGSATASGSFTFTVTAADANGNTGSRSYTLAVSAPTISMTPAALADATARVAYSQTLTASGGEGPYAYAVTAGALPSGMTLASGGLLSGTATAAGRYVFTVTATDANGNSGEQGYVLNVVTPVIVLAPGTVSSAVVGAPYTLTISASGGIGAYDYAVTAGALPRGLTLSDAGGLSGTPTEAGIFTLTVTATDSLGFTGASAYVLSVAAPTLTVNSAALTGLTTGAPFSATLTTSGGTAPYSYAVTAGALPNGLTLASTGVLSGTPTAGGVFDFSVTATDSSTGLGAPFSTRQDYSVTVAAPVIVVSPASLPTGRMGVAYSETVSASGGVGDYRYAVTCGALPAGLTLTPTGLLSGTPTVNGIFGFTITATDSAGGAGPYTGSAAYALAIAVPEAPTAGGISASVAYGSTGSPIASVLSGGIATSVTVLTPPAHGSVTVSGLGFIYTPNAEHYGADSFTYFASNEGGSSDPAVVTVNVDLPPAPTTTDRSGVEVPYASTGVVIDLTASISGVRTGIAIGSGPMNGRVTVSGETVTYVPNPTSSGPDSFTFTAAGPGGTSAPATVSVIVAAPPPPVIAPPTDPVVVPPSSDGGGSTSISLGQITEGVVDGYRITVTGAHGTAELVQSIPPLLTVARSTTPQASAATVELVYTPAAGFMGTDAVTVVAYGPGGDSAPATFTFQMAGKAPDLTAQVSSNASVTISPTAGLVGGPFNAVRITGAPAFGTATVNGLDIVFTPGAANGGSTFLTYVIDLPFGTSAAGRIDLTSNLVPGGQALTAETVQGRPVTVRISDTVGGPFTAAAVTSISPTTAGTATVEGSGGVYNLTFTPANTFSGQAVVGFTLSNGFGTTSGTVTVTVEARPDPGLDPEVRGVASSQVTSARRFADAQISNFQRRLQDLHDGTNGSSSGVNLNIGVGGQADMDNDPREALRRELGMREQDRLDPGALGDDRSRDMLGLDLWADRQVGPAATAAADPSTSNLSKVAAAGTGGRTSTVGFWTAGSVDWGRQDARGQRDYRFTTQGVTAGLDVRVSDQLIIGAGLGYGEDKTKIGDNGSVSTGHGFTGALYGSWRPAEAFYIDGVIGWADLDFSSRRWTDGIGGDPSAYAEGDRSGDTRFVSAAFGRIMRGDTLVSEYYARLDARSISLDGFTETGAGLSSLIWDAVEQDSVSANLGASWRWLIEHRTFGTLRPSARLEWSHEFEDIGDQGVRYADWAASPTYLVQLDAWSRDNLRIELGTDWEVSDRLSLGVGYRGAFGDAGSSHGGELRVKYGW